jgi:hypothetical protein
MSSSSHGSGGGDARSLQEALHILLTRLSSLGWPPPRSTSRIGRASNWQPRLRLRLRGILVFQQRRSQSPADLLHIPLTERSRMFCCTVSDLFREASPRCSSQQVPS